MNEMKRAVEGATTWLLKIAQNTNPIPYGLFKSGINRRIGWAAEKGITLDFDTLAEEIKKSLAYQGVQVMPNKYVKQQEEIHTADGFFLNDSDKFVLTSRDGFSKMFSWLYSVFEKAEREDFPQIIFTTEFTKGETN